MKHFCNSRDYDKPRGYGALLDQQLAALTHFQAVWMGYTVFVSQRGYLWWERWQVSVYRDGLEYVAEDRNIEVALARLLGQLSGGEGETN